MSIQNVFLLIFSASLWCSCQSDERPGQEQEQAAWDEVMAVHDEVMPHMSQLARAKSHFSRFLDANPGLADSTRLRLENQSLEIGEAQEAMMDWMNQLVSPLDSLRSGRAHDEVMDYLSKEKGLIEEVRDEMMITLEKSEALLGELGIEGE